MRFSDLVARPKAALVVSVTVLALLAAPASAQDFVRGYDAYYSGDYETALANIRPLAEQGGLAAQYYLGAMYANGHGVPQDHAQAVQWFRKAAEQGDAASQYELATAFAQGLGVDKDIDEAFVWICRAANQGHEEADMDAFYLGLECQAE